MTRIITAEEAARILNSLPMYSEPGIIGDLARTVVELEQERDEAQRRYVMWTEAAETVAKEHAAAHERAAKAEGVVAAMREEMRAVLGACVIPATTQIAYAGDLAMYVRACMDAVAADHAASVKGLEAAVDHAAERIGEVVAERDRLRDVLDCERGVRAPEGWHSCGGWLREWEREYNDGTVARVKGDGSWWYGRRGRFDFTGGPSAMPEIYAQGPVGLKLESIEAADLAAKGGA